MVLERSAEEQELSCAVQEMSVVGPAAQIILTSVVEVYGVWNLATDYHGTYFLSFLQTSSLLQAPIQAGLALDCVEETSYFTNIYFS